MPWLILFQLGQGFATVGITAGSLGVSPSLASVLLFLGNGLERFVERCGGAEGAGSERLAYERQSMPSVVSKRGWVGS